MAAGDAWCSPAEAAPAPPLSSRQDGVIRTALVSQCSAGPRRAQTRTHSMCMNAGVGKRLNVNRM